MMPVHSRSASVISAYHWPSDMVSSEAGRAAYSFTLTKISEQSQVAILQVPEMFLLVELAHATVQRHVVAARTDQQIAVAVVSLVTVNVVNALRGLEAPPKDLLCDQYVLTGVGSSRAVHVGVSLTIDCRGAGNPRCPRPSSCTGATGNPAIAYSVVVTFGHEIRATGLTLLECPNGPLVSATTLRRAILQRGSFRSPVTMSPKLPAPKAWGGRGQRSADRSSHTRI